MRRRVSRGGAAGRAQGPTARRPRTAGGDGGGLARALALAVLLATGAPLVTGVGVAAAPFAAQPVPPVPPIEPIDPAQVPPTVDPEAGVPGAGSRYFAETGHNLADPFRTRWEAAGGMATLGPPESEERYAEGAGGVLQTFAGLTLIYDPSQPAPLDVRGQELDAGVRETAAPLPARRRVAGCDAAAGFDCRFFPETGHTLSGALATFWAAHGDLAIFGAPLSEPFADAAPATDPAADPATDPAADPATDPAAITDVVLDPGTGVGVTTQVFERAILEDRGAAGVALRPVGADAAAANAADPAFQPAPPTGGTTFLVGANEGLRLRTGPDLNAEMVALLPENAEFIAANPWDGDWVPGYADGFAGWVSAQFLREAPPLPQLLLADWNPEVWQGAALGETNVRAEPSTRARAVEELAYGDPVTVVDWVAGEEVHKGADLWAKLGERRYVYARNVGRNAPVAPLPPPADAPTVGKWIDVDLTQQLLVAYDGRTPIRTVVTTTGMAGWETPPGFYQILNRVANETMTSGAIGAEHHYKLEDVLFTQYFTDRGHALHFAWWRTEQTIGRPGSHGCLNLLLDDARFFWDWADLGTGVYVHP